jgi:hypothetical protein
MFLHGKFPKSRDIATAVEPHSGTTRHAQGFSLGFRKGELLGDLALIPRAVFYPAGSRLQRFSQFMRATRIQVATVAAGPLQ